MPLPLSGAMTFNDLNVELGFSGTAQISMGDAAVRALFTIASGEIKMSNGYGKSASFQHTITTNQQELNLRTYLLSVGWDGVEAVEVTINTGVYIWSDNRTIAALTTGSPYAGGLTLINEGFIMGKGGDGGYVQANRTTYVNPTTGGPALVLDVPITINNASGYIGGGGGGGAGSNAEVINVTSVAYMSPGGGGAGGGRGGPCVSGNTDGTVLNSFGAGGALGQNGSIDATGINTWPTHYPPTHGGGGGGGGACAIKGA